MLKSSASIGAALIAAALLQAAPAAADDVTLRVLHSTPADLYDAIDSKFSETNPGIGFTSDPPPADYDVLTEGLLRSALTNDLPDVVFQGYNRTDITIDRGIAVPLEDRIAAEPNWQSSGYSKTVLDMCSRDGKPYGLPFATSATIVYFNLDLVARAGHDPRHLPTDWDGILALGKDVTALGNSTTGVFFDYNVTGNLTFQVLLASLGGEFVTKDGKIGFDNDKGLAALDLLSKFSAAGQVDMTRNQAWQAFSAGGLGVLISTSSLLPQFEAQAAGHFQISTGAFPMSPAGTSMPAGGNCAMIVTKDPAKQQAAWNYIKFASGPIGQTIIALKSGYIPMNTLAIDDPKLLGDYYAQHPNYLTAVKQLPILAPFQSFPGDNSVKITKVINEHLQTVVTNQTKPADALAAMVSDVNALLPH